MVKVETEELEWGSLLLRVNGKPFGHLESDWEGWRLFDLDYNNPYFYGSEYDEALAVITREIEENYVDDVDPWVQTKPQRGGSFLRRWDMSLLDFYLQYYDGSTRYMLAKITGTRESSWQRVNQKPLGGWTAIQIARLGKFVNRPAETVLRELQAFASNGDITGEYD